MMSGEFRMQGGQVKRFTCVTSELHHGGWGGEEKG